MILQLVLLDYSPEAGHEGVVQEMVVQNCQRTPRYHANAEISEAKTRCEHDHSHVFGAGQCRAADSSTLRITIKH